MAKETLELTKTRAVLEQYAEAWKNAYKAELIAEGKRATGNLIKTIEAKVVVEGDEMSAVLSVGDYYKYVENGRRKDAKQPPIDAILQWIKVKPIVPRENSASGRIPTERQLAYSIARSIREKGIPPTHAMRDANEATFNAFERKLTQALEEDLATAAYMIVKRVIPKE